MKHMQGLKLLLSFMKRNFEHNKQKSMLRALLILKKSHIISKKIKNNWFSILKKVTFFQQNDKTL